MASVFSCSYASLLTEAAEIFAKETSQSTFDVFEWTESVDISLILTKKREERVMLDQRKNFVWRNIEWSLLVGSSAVLPSNVPHIGTFLGFDNAKQSDISSLSEISFQVSLVDQNSKPILQGWSDLFSKFKLLILACFVVTVDSHRISVITQVFHSFFRCHHKM